jgi:NAD(P)-dependent dehydrogenase (short-subunit alcohol dehydrogenase family)
LNIEDTVAVVTGGASGIGLGIATALAEHGARVFIADIDANRAQVEAYGLNAGGLRAHAAGLDVTRPGIMERSGETGASSGIGKEVAQALVARGRRIIALGRDATRSAAALFDIRAASTTGQVDMIRADLSLLADAARAAREIAALTDRIDVLVNNAGGMAKQKVVTSEGSGANFCSNHLGPFLLTNRVLPLLRRAASDALRGSVRILDTASGASEMIPGMDWNDLQGLVNFNAGLAYCRAKLANVLFCVAWPAGWSRMASWRMPCIPAQSTPTSFCMPMKQTKLVSKPTSRARWQKAPIP